MYGQGYFRNVFLQHEITLDSPTDYINHSLYFEAKHFYMDCLLLRIKYQCLLV